MGSSFSLDYYDRIFGDRTEAYSELLAALADELEDYASRLPVALASSDAAAVTQLRHAHRPLVENLRLTQLQVLEATIRESLEDHCPGPVLADLGAQFRNEALLAAQALTSERLRDARGPRPPSPGG